MAGPGRMLFLCKTSESGVQCTPYTEESIASVGATNGRPHRIPYAHVGTGVLDGPLARLAWPGGQSLQIASLESVGDDAYIVPHRLPYAHVGTGDPGAVPGIFAGVGAPASAADRGHSLGSLFPPLFTRFPRSPRRSACAVGLSGRQSLQIASLESVGDDAYIVPNKQAKRVDVGIDPYTIQVFCKGKGILAERRNVRWKIITLTTTLPKSAHY